MVATRMWRPRTWDVCSARISVAPNATPVNAWAIGPVPLTAMKM